MIFKRIPQEIEDQIMMSLSSEDLEIVNKEYLSEHVYLRKFVYRNAKEAVRKGNLKYTKYYIEKDQCDLKYLLYASIKYAHLEIVKFFVEQGIIQHYTPIIPWEINPIQHEHLGVLKYLKEKGVHIKTFFNFNQLLRESVSQGNLEITIFLVEQCGVNIACPNCDALELSARYGHLDIVKYLISQGADVNFRGGFPLINAYDRGHIDIVKYLLDQGANIHSFNDYLFRFAKTTDFVKSLMDRVDYSEWTKEMTECIKEHLGYIPLKM